jgi:hypothetical protein
MRTEGVSAAFIKELMRRTAQTVASHREGRVKDTPEPTEKDLAAALDDMLFSGGVLNVKLLGGGEAHDGSAGSKLCAETS